MIIKDVITLAKHSELSGAASKNNVEAIVAFINLGLLELYKRFPIRIEEHIIELVDDQMYYEMPSNFMYALSAYGEIPEDSTESSKELSINNEDDPESVFFTDWNTLQIPAAVMGSVVSLSYVSKPTSITEVQADDGVTIIDLPDTLVDALLSYVGYRAHLGIKSDAQSENNAHWSRFERICKKAADLGVAYPSDSMEMSGRISNRGFA